MYKMPVKSHKYHKINNKSRRTRKNKTTQRYKKQIKGGNGPITNENELKKSWDNGANIFWEVDDGVGGKRFIYSQNLTYEQFKKKINHYLKQVEKKQKGAYIKKI